MRRVTDHEHVIQCFDVFEDDTDIFLVLELMQCSLIDFMKMRGGRLSEREAAAVTWRVARGIDHIHRCGIVHFDLKPANILVNIDKQLDCITSVKIADFGVS